VSLIEAALQRSAARAPVRQHAPPVATALIAMIVLLAIWQVVARLGLVKHGYLPAPSAVAAAGMTMVRDGELWQNAQLSLLEFAVGLALSIGVGIPLGLLMGWFRTVREVFEPLVMTLNAMPRIALIPVIVVWLGIGTTSKIAVVFIGAVIPLIVNGMAGVRDADGTLIRLARSFCASDLQLFLKILLPGAVPSLLVGLRLAIGHAVIGVILAEMYASVRGMGYLLQTYGTNYEAAELFFLVIVVSVVGYLATACVQIVESRFQAWRQS
jgi:ABC-type nitrate/sulfonate/bicarbonate transport system permease component